MRCTMDALRRYSLKRQQSRDDPPLFGPQDTPRTGSGTTIHRFHADPQRFEGADEGTPRLLQARPGSQQQEFGLWLQVEQIAERRKVQIGGTNRRVPSQRPHRRQQEATGKHIVTHAKAAPRKAGDDRPLPRIITAQFDACTLVAQGCAPSFGPMRSA